LSEDSWMRKCTVLVIDLLLFAGAILLSAQILDDIEYWN